MGPIGGGGNQTMQIYGNFQGFPRKMTCLVWVGVMFHEPWNMEEFSVNSEHDFHSSYQFFLILNIFYRAGYQGGCQKWHL